MDRRRSDMQKEIIKEALSEWLDKKFAAFGKWTAAGIMAMAFAVLIYQWLRIHGIDVRTVQDVVG